MLSKILKKEKMTQHDLMFLLQLTKDSDMDVLFRHALAVKKQFTGDHVYFRGLIEFSNICDKDCFYCGIRKGNQSAERFHMSVEEIASMAKWAFDNDYGSVTLQSGERQSDQFTEFVRDAIKAIKSIGGGALGITLSLGEQTSDVYRHWFDAGAHRYLLRIESSNQDLFEQVHPRNELHSFKSRVACLTALKDVGFQTGTGVMIGLPGQRLQHLADDILFFEKMDIDMVGMGPYVVHKGTPLGARFSGTDFDSDAKKHERLALALKMIAVTRTYLKNINIASATALQALDPAGRELGIKAGANILMPIVSMPHHAKKYRLYDNKPFFDDGPQSYKQSLIEGVERAGATVGFSQLGDSPKAVKKAVNKSCKETSK